MSIKQLLLSLMMLAGSAILSYSEQNKTTYLIVTLTYEDSDEPEDEWQDEENPDIKEADTRGVNDEGDSDDNGKNDDGDSDGNINDSDDNDNDDEGNDEEEQGVSKFCLTDDFKIYNCDDYLFFKSCQYEEYIAKDRIKSFGFLIDITTSISGILKDLEGGWAIYDTRGVQLKSGKDGHPDFGSLEKGRIYIIEEGNKTYKYIHIR